MIVFPQTIVSIFGEMLTCVKQDFVKEIDTLIQNYGHQLNDIIFHK